MPFGDGTGPRGMGPMTGRGAGYCAGFGMPGFANPIPGRGWLGLRRGFGRGLGRGFAWRMGYGYPYPYAGYGYPHYGAGYGIGYMPAYGYPRC